MNTNVNDDQMDNLVAAVAAGDITYITDPDEAAAALKDLPPAHDGSEIMAVYSTRMPATLAQRLAQIAKAKGVKPAALMREYIEIGVAAEEDDRPISLTDALRALTQLRKAA